MENLNEMEMGNPIDFAAKHDPDTMYFHQAIKQLDAPQFVEVIVKEINGHIERGHWQLIPFEDVLKETKILYAVWAMKQKRDIKARKITKYKTRLNVHGGQQKYGINYFDTYAPVVTWPSVRLILGMAILNPWGTKQVDFAMAYPQADIECDCLMECR
eukprot:12507552-Ditylum_brightwellii.AAC.1